jgi:hypothetical protein
MKNNQHTTKVPMTGRNLNVRLSAELRAQLGTQATRLGLTDADVVREALAFFLPVLAGRPAKESSSG